MAEQDAIDEYVFGGVKDIDTNLISSLETAIQLWKKLSRGGRRFEIIYCRDPQRAICSEVEKGTPEHLGYDVATVSTEYWSIVDDISLSDWAIPYRRRLNENGLLPERSDAERYLRDYRSHGEWDANFPFDIIEVIRIKLGERT